MLNSEFPDTTQPGLFPHLVIDAIHMKASAENSDAFLEFSELNGEATVHYLNGGVYQGPLLNGVMEGVGEYNWPDGTLYKGEFTKNKISGKGVYTW
jgi:hypothetical protein